MQNDYRAYITITGLTGERYVYRGKEYDRVKHVRHFSAAQALNSEYKVVAEDGTVLCTGKQKDTDNFFRKQYHGQDNFHSDPSRNHGLLDFLLNDQTVTVYVRPLRVRKAA